MKIFRSLINNWFTIFIYASILFLVYYLIKSDIFFLPKIHRPLFLLISIIFLLAGFLFEMFAWFSLLKLHLVEVSYRTIIIGSGMTILGKYIPGKVWAVMGRAKVISEKNDERLSKISFISFEAQIILLWTGLVLSLIGSIISNIEIEYILLIVVFLFIFSVIIFSDKYKIVTEKLLSKVFKKNYTLPKLSYKNTYVILLNFMPWISWTVGFYLLVISISSAILPFSVSYSFVISITFGVIAIFSPGGLGVRESIMTGFLTMSGLTLPVAISISVFSRMWFLVGEILIFLLAIYTKTFRKD